MILINLLPEALRRKETPKLNLPEIPVKKTIIAMVAFILVAQSLMSVAALFYVVRYQWVKKESEALTTELAGIRQVKSQTISTGNKLKEIKVLTEKKFYWASILNALTETATKGIWLRSLSLEEQTVVETVKKAEGATTAGSVRKSEKKTHTTYTLKIEGSCAGSGQETALIGKYLKALKEHPYFQEIFGTMIDLSNINQRKISDYDVFDFVVISHFKKDKI